MTRRDQARQLERRRAHAERRDDRQPVDPTVSRQAGVPPRPPRLRERLRERARAKR